MGILTPRLIAELRGTLSRRQEELTAELQQRESAATRETELEEVRAALQRIDSGSYGVCQECGKPISPQRLRASPTARYDFLHQQQTERGAAPGPTL